jgi:hypothetical protein
LQGRARYGPTRAIPGDVAVQGADVGRRGSTIRGPATVGEDLYGSPYFPAKPGDRFIEVIARDPSGPNRLTCKGPLSLTGVIRAGRIHRHFVPKEARKPGIEAQRCSRALGDPPRRLKICGWALRKRGDEASGLIWR